MCTTLYYPVRIRILFAYIFFLGAVLGGLGVYLRNGPRTTLRGGVICRRVLYGAEASS